MSTDKTNRENAQVVEIDRASFDLEVIRDKKPVLVAFLTPWSQACQVINSVLEEVTRACAGRLKTVKIDADNNPDLSWVYKIHSIPTLLCFVNGEVCAQIVGTASKEAVLSKLKPFVRPNERGEKIV